MKNKPDEPTVRYLRLWDIIGCKERRIAPLMPVSRSTWLVGVKSGRFPKPVNLGPRTVAWRDTDINALIKKMAAAEVTISTDRPPVVVEKPKHGTPVGNKINLLTKKQIDDMYAVVRDISYAHDLLAKITSETTLIYKHYGIHASDALSKASDLLKKYPGGFFE